MLNIIAYIKEFAQSEKLSFNSGFGEKMNKIRIEFPMLWIESIELIGKNGINEGSITYKVKLNILDRDQNLSQQLKEYRWEQMQTMAIDIYDYLMINPRIITTRNLRCTPTKSALTNYGEISLSVSFEIDELYCKNTQL